MQAYEHNPVSEWKSAEPECTIVNLMIPDDTSNLPCYPSDIMTYLQNITMPDEEDYHYPSEASLTEIDIDTAEVPSYKKSCERLTSIFGSNTSICEYFIEFRDVPCRQLCKKTIDITNIMDVLSSFSTTIKNFKSTIMHRKKLDDILINLNWKPDDKYTQQLSEYGIEVIIDPESSELKNKSTVSIELQVYAETWGFYLEEVGIEVEDLPVFYINVFIQVTGLPIEFPMKTNNLDLLENAVRFGSRSVCSPMETRTIFFTNNCTIPYTIVWHVFVKNIEDYLKGSINIAYDIFGFGSANTSTNCNLRILSYSGKETSRIFNLFKIEPHETYIKPKEIKSVQVSLNPEYFLNGEDFINIEAVLIGNIYIEDQYQIIKNESNFVIRHPEKELDPIKINFFADIEPGEIDLNCIVGERSMKVAVSDFLHDVNSIVASMRLVFRNTAAYTVVIGLKIVEPFSIVSVKSNANECTEPDNNNMYTSVVHSDCCAEVKVQCLINTDTLMLLADVLYRDSPHFIQNISISKNNQIKINRELTIYQKCNIKQKIPISLTLAFPWTIVSEDALDFKQVHIRTKKKMTVKLLNKTASHTWFIASLESETGSVFRVDPCKGYLDPAHVMECSTYLTITFAPKDIRDYEDTLTVVTCVSQYQQEVKLTGMGTFNEKYICEVAVDK